MIIESLVTTLDKTGHPNVAPMGVEWGEGEIVLKPYRETATFRNLVETEAAVCNLVDEIGYYVKSALESPVFPSRPAKAVTGIVLEAACSWRELRVLEADTRGARGRFVCTVVHSEDARPFIGYNRARNAVLEATILATRTRILPIDEILADLARLQVIVDKTAGEQEREAMDELQAFVRKESEILKAGPK
jgi:hypothetical protein